MLGLGQNIRKLRERDGKTQREIADALGVTSKTVSFYELGQRIPPVDVLLKLAAIFDVSTDNLLGVVPILGHPAPDTPMGAAIQQVAREEELLAAFRSLPAEQQTSAVAVVQALAANASKKHTLPKYTNSPTIAADDRKVAVAR